MNNFKASILCLLILEALFSNMVAKELLLPPLQKTNPLACWATCTKMTLDAYGYTNNSNTRITEKELEDAVCGYNTDCTNQLFGTSQSVDMILMQKKQIFSTQTPYNRSTGGGNVSQSDLIYEIDKGRPILSGWLYGDGKKHMVLIRGYSGSGGTIVGNVAYNDPDNGQTKYLSYAEFVRQGDTRVWYETLRLTTNPAVTIPVGIGPHEYVLINTAPFAILPTTQSITVTAQKSGAHIPVLWTWRLVFPSKDGDCIVRTSTTSGPNFTSTWNITNFSMPVGYAWKYNFEGKIPGRVEVKVDDNAGPPAHEDAINVLYVPNSTYPGVLIYENKTISTFQADVKAHELIIMQNDQFLSGTSISLKSGIAIDINNGITVENGGLVNIVVDPILR